MTLEEFKRLMKEFCELNEAKLKHYTQPSDYYYLYIDYTFDMDIDPVIVVFTPEEIEDCSWDIIETKIKKGIQSEIDDINKSIQELQRTQKKLQDRYDNLKLST